VSASWGVDPQALGGDEVVRERMPERMSLRLDEPANGEKTKGLVLGLWVLARALRSASSRSSAARALAARA
jgi:hypothetical protein